MQGIKEKIKKLLSLANNTGATEGEAERAMAMASALMMKYNVQVNLDKEEIGVIRGQGVMPGCDSSWHQVLASTSATLYNCKSIVKGYEGRTAFVGRPENVGAAEVTYQYLIEQVERLYKVNLPKGLSVSDRAEFRRTFKYACAIRVYRRAQELIQSFKTNNSAAIEYTGSKALVLVQSIDRQLMEAEEFMKKEFPEMRTVVTRSKSTGSGTLKGRMAGDTVNLNKKVG